jgi:SAM-dependent methyltransferase
LQAIDLSAEKVRRIARVCDGMLNPLPRPMRLWHLRRWHEPLGYALRLLMYDDPVTDDQARLALGDFPLQRLLDAGVVTRREDGRLASPFLLSVVGPLFVFCDDLRLGDDAVMGAGNTTGELCNAVWPRRPIARALDLGCGAGTVALVLARQASSVVGTDVNPRAISLARFNAALNAVSNVDFRLGDLFEPVADESFDLIASQPPFIAQPEDVGDAAWQYGGARGDELPLRILSEIATYLREDGRAVVMVEWPEVDDVPLESRVRAALRAAVPAGERATPARVLLLQTPPTDLDEHCTSYALGERRELGRHFEERATRRRDHLAREGICGLRLTLNVVERAAPEWTASVEILPLSSARLTSAHIDRLLAAQTLLAAGREALLGANLYAPEGATFVEGTTGTVRVTFADLRAPVDLGKGAALLVSRVHEAGTVRGAVETFAPSLGLPLPEAVDKALESVRHALRAGVLCVE